MGDDVTSGQKAPLGRKLRNFRLHMRTSFQCGYCATGCACAYPRNPLRGTSRSPVGHAHILYYYSSKKKSGKTPGMRRTYFRGRPGTLLVTWLTSLPITWLPVAPPPQIWFEIISNYNMETPKKRLNKYWYSVPHYLSDIRNIYIKADRFPFMMLTAANKERKQI